VLVDCNASQDFAASGRSEVVNLKQGSSITVSNVIAGTSLDIRYCTRNDPGKLALYVNDVHQQDLTFESTGSWDTTYAVFSVNVTIPAGATIKLQYEAGSAGANIDSLQVK
jgi:hypothetical protein